MSPELAERLAEISTSMGPSFHDEVHRRCSELPVTIGRNGAERSQVVSIVWAPSVVSRQEFESDQMPHRRHWHHQTIDDLHVLGCSSYLSFDGRRGEEQVDHDRPLRVALRQSDSRQPTGRLLFDERCDLVLDLQPPYQILGVIVIEHRDDEVGVASQAGFGASRDRQSSDQCMALALASE